MQRDIICKLNLNNYLYNHYSINTLHTLFHLKCDYKNTNNHPNYHFFRQRLFILSANALLLIKYNSKPTRIVLKKEARFIFRIELQNSKLQIEIALVINYMSLMFFFTAMLRDIPKHYEAIRHHQ